MTRTVLVIGGGPAGAAAAIQLARAGVQVTLVERDREAKHKVCGEFLSDEALRYLALLGIDTASLGAVALHRVRMAGHRRVTECALPFPAMSLTRRCMDSALLARAEAAGAVVLRGHPVEQLTRVNGGWSASLDKGDAITADTVFLATGKHDVRGHPRAAGRQPGLVAFKMYWRLDTDETAALDDAVELVTYRGGYAGLQRVEGGLANLCCLVRASDFRAMGASWSSLLEHMRRESPHLRMRLRDADPQMERPLTIASLPYGFVRATSDSLWYLGDQAVVIPSFTGDGMSLALHTGALAARMYVRGQSAADYQKVLAAQVRRQVGLATWMSRAVVRSPRISLLLPTLWPGALGVIAKQTRIDPACMLDGSVE